MRMTIGGARRKVAEVAISEEQRKANLYKSKIADDDFEFLDKFMKEALPHANKNLDTMVTVVRRVIGNAFKGELGLDLAKEVAGKVSREQTEKWLRANTQRKREERGKEIDWEKENTDDVLEIAYNTTRGSLTAMLKKARLLKRGITMDDVKRWRLENTNKEKKTTRKSFNSWVGNRAKDEYQVDLFFFKDLKKQQAEEELRKEKEMALAAAGGDEQAIKISKRSRELLRKIKELTWEYESGLMVVDTFSKRLAIVPMKKRDWLTLKASLEAAFRKLNGKPGSVYSDAEASLTSRDAQNYFRQAGIVHNITLGHAPVAERMIGVMKSRIVEGLEKGNSGQMWWNVVDQEVNDYNQNHVSRSTKMTPNAAAESGNRDEVKTNLESIRRMDNPQENIGVGDQVRVMIKKKFDKNYMPDWSNALYKVRSAEEGNHLLGEDDRPVDPQKMYRLEDPENDLPRYKDRYMRHELLLVKKNV